MLNSRIIGTGSYLPLRIVTNEELSSRLETSDAWIRERTGIGQRHIADPDQTTTDMALPAALAALESAGLTAQDLDLIILATSTAEHVYPSSAALLQARLGNVGAAAFDLTAACSGFIYALATADNFIRAGRAKRALVVGAEVYSRILDWNDRTTCVLFGDGGGAVVLEASEQEGILSTHLHADGRYKDLLWVPRGAGSQEGDPFVHMRGNEVFKFAVNTLRDIVAETLAANQIEPEQIDWLIPHQANLRIISATARKLGMTLDRVVLTVETQANTSAASIPLALDGAVRDGRIQRGQLLLLEAFGGGFTWGSALVRF